jgi:NAD(P)-dependent dehydrogenase (short-subunit alcohol dehydrogenase family)
MNQPLINILSFKGKRVMITGTTSGIGKSTALRFAEAGAHLMLVNRSEMEENPAEVFLGASGISTYKVDLSQKKDIDAMWAAITDEELPDIIVNNAGIYPMKEFKEVDEEFYRKVIQINMDSVFWMCQQFITRRDTKGGVIVNTSSIEAILPTTKDLIPYGASKAGIIAMTRGIAREYGAKGFRANVLTPGGIMTEGTDKKKIQTILSLNFKLIMTGIDFQRRIANGKWGNADDVAKVTLFLASDLASYVQGAVIPVDGGFLST